VPTPLAARGAKSKANLRKGGPGRHKRVVLDEVVRKFSRKALTDSTYRKTLLKRLREGTIQPGTEALLYYYAYGKPRESVEVQAGPGLVKIEHVYEDTPKPKKAAPEKDKP